MHISVLKKGQPMLHRYDRYMVINEYDITYAKASQSRWYTMNHHLFLVFFLFFALVLDLMKGLNFLEEGNVVMLRLVVYGSSKSSSSLGSSNW